MNAAKYRKDPVGYYLTGIVVTHQGDKYLHEKFGVVAVNTAPLKSVVLRCMSKAYEGISVNFNGTIISNPNTLYQIEVDYIKYLRESLDDYFEKKNDHLFDLPHMAFGKMKWKHLKELKSVSNAAEIRSRCVKNSGWKLVERNN